MSLIIPDRATAGQRLGRALLHYRKQQDVIVLALPRGGVPVAAEIARALHAPLDVLIVRKLGAPGHAELAIGAIASGSVRVVNRDIVESLRIGQKEIEAVAGREHPELLRRMNAYRGVRPWPDLKDRRVIVVDDGIATGATMEAAIAAVRAQSPASVIVAAPIAPVESLVRVRREADLVVCLETPHPFGAVSTWYGSYPQVTDEQVREVLTERWAEEDALETASGPLGVTSIGDREARELAARPNHTEHVTIFAGDAALEGVLSVPGPAHGLVLFAQAGDGRFTQRNRNLADRLNAVGFATLRLDLLTAAEQQLDLASGALRYDIALLTRRLASAFGWLETHSMLHGLPIGVFGAGASSAAALCAAAQAGNRVAAMVLRSSRPDLAMSSLPLIKAPTLLIAGGADEAVLAINRRATAELACVHHLEVVPGASHVFDEQGKLEQVARLTRAWFEQYLKPRSAVIRAVRSVLSPSEA